MYWIDDEFIACGGLAVLFCRDKVVCVGSLKAIKLLLELLS